MLGYFKAVRGNAGAPARGARTKDGLGIFADDVLALVKFDEVFARGNYLRPFGNREDRGTL